MEEFKNVLNKAQERGYYLHNSTADNSRYNFLREDGLGLIVYPKTEEFEVYYNVDLVTSLKGGKCGSFLNDKHFNSQESRISRYMYILKNHTI